MKSIILAMLLSVNGCSDNENKCEKYKLKDSLGFSPINNQVESRYDDKDICEIFHGKDLRDHVVDIEGKSPSPSPENK